VKTAELLEMRHDLGRDLALVEGGAARAGDLAQGGAQRRLAKEIAALGNSPPGR